MYSLDRDFSGLRTGESLGKTVMRLISSALPEAGFVGFVLDRNVPRVDGAV